MNAEEYRPSGHDVIVGKPFAEPPFWYTVVDPDDPRLRWDRNGMPYLVDEKEPRP